MKQYKATYETRTKQGLVLRSFRLSATNESCAYARANHMLKQKAAYKKARYSTHLIKVEEL